ncbi:hypothetical protein ACLKA6_004170 [Drosophila palustris]
MADENTNETKAKEKGKIKKKNGPFCGFSGTACSTLRVLLLQESPALRRNDLKHRTSKEQQHLSTKVNNVQQAFGLAQFSMTGSLCFCCRLNDLAKWMSG